MGFLIAEITILLVLSAVAGGALTYWWTRRQYRDVTQEFNTLQVELDAARARLAAPPLELTPHEDPKPQSSVNGDSLAPLLSRVEQALSDVNDAQIARVKSLERQVRTLSRQLQDTLPHPVDGQDIARRLDTLGAAMPQPKLNQMEARLVRLETMITGLCTQAGIDVPPQPALSRLPSSPNQSRLPSIFGSANATSASPSQTQAKPPSAPPSRPPSRIPRAPASAPSNPAPSEPPKSVAPKAPRPPLAD